MTDMQKEVVDSLVEMYPVSNDLLYKNTALVIRSVDESDLSDMLLSILVDRDEINKYGAGRVSLPVVYRYAQKYINRRAEQHMKKCEDFIISKMDEIRSVWEKNIQGEQERRQMIENIKLPDLDYKGAVFFRKEDYIAAAEGGNAMLKKTLGDRMRKALSIKRLGDAGAKRLEG